MRRILLAALFLPTAALAQDINVTISVDASKPVAPLKPIYRFFGADEPNYAYMKDGRKLLKEIGSLGTPQTYFRAHNLLTSGDLTPALKWGSTNVYTEDAKGNPVYDFTTVDRIFDAYLAGGVKPYVQLGFMPEALSTKPQPYQHEWRPGLPYQDIMTGWSYPPKDYNKWRDLCQKLTEHLISRYGKAEVETWYFECWNEANGHYWHGTPEEWYKLHDYAIDGVRRALPAARVGGPHVAGSGGKFARDFYEHAIRGTNFATGTKGSPLDFVSFHAKGSPSFVNGKVRMGINAQLKAIDNGFKLISDFPELKRTPIVIGESDPDGCAACQGPQLGYRNGTMYSSYTAASFARKHLLAEKHGVNLEGALTWAFEFEDQPYFAGFRVLATNGIELPVFNVFRMFARMQGNRLATTSTHEIPLEEMVEKGARRELPDIAALASADDKGIYILTWHYHDDDLEGPQANVTLNLSGLVPSSFKVTEYRVDTTHSNAYTVWKSMGSPTAPTDKQYAGLKEASKLAITGPATTLTQTDGKAQLTLTLPRQGVSLLVLQR